MDGNDVRAVGGSPAQARKVWVSSFLGATIEFYDFSIYSTASALVLAPLFFSGVSPSVGLTLSFATLAIGYAARPIGAVVFGHFGDRVGRKSTLIATIVLMAVATFLIGCLPTTAQIGVAAPVLLVLLRLLQGISVGGEWGGSVVLTTEHSSARRRGLMGSATMTGASAGVLLGFVAYAIMVPLSGDGFMTWGWRVPFWVTVVLFALAFYMRLKVDETPVMKTLQAEAPTERRELPITALLTRYPGTVMLAAGVFVGAFMLQQVMISFFVSYGVSDLGQTQSAMINASMIGVAVSFVAIPLAGLLTDRFGRRRVLLTGIGLQTLNCLLIWPFLNSGDYGLILTSFCLVFLFHSLCYAPLAALYSELFPSSMRYTGVSMAYQVASLIGGFGPLFATLLIGAGLSPVWVIGLLLVGMLVSLGCALAMPRTDHVDLTEVGEKPAPAAVEETTR
ncbi:MULTISPECIES: MFS transporter [Pseudonocardia]|uniref:Inner membrane metabolite transport protein YhjE n=2 Tax=Pseudonocardia TaxID=1847 RepID=A0A1Y2MZW8_PSEAH|nr:MULTISPECIES: MFS transporter [Pseudonocardia]OSY40753.1 Inner membrane metabolite transport protein YhjE [Pseudonocardia autotrophica]TDN71940.1 MFS transporter [Pseudonocardia autotrophica]BBG02627.1 MFS transporter [Pseudonocardia autotrophica]GEC24686.1 MFS transporter [Pseudonocardia saturnea]